MKDKVAEIEELGRFFSEFNKETARGAALVAASMLEQRLGEILEAFLIMSSASTELLVGFNAPLGTFSARATAAFALGLIEQNEFTEITAVRKIRNEFGHAWQPRSFESGRVADLCRQLPWRGPHELEAGSNLRTRFSFAVAMLLTDFLWRVRLVKRERRSHRVWPSKTRTT